MLSAEIKFDNIPVLEGIEEYIKQNAIPGGTNRNWKSFESKTGTLTENQKLILADPQTSGGLLVAIDENDIPSLIEISNLAGIEIHEIGIFTKAGGQEKMIKID